MTNDTLFMVVMMKVIAYEFERIATKETLQEAIDFCPALRSLRAISRNKSYLIFGWPSYHVVWHNGFTIPEEVYSEVSEAE